MFNLIRSEFSMMNTTINRGPDSSVMKACIRKDTDTYYVEATGASATADSSVDVIHRYCGKLPGDKY
jgi:endoribonuclease Dicer